MSFSPSSLLRAGSSWRTWAAALLFWGSAAADLNNETSPTSQFKSRPDIHPPILDFGILRPELVTPGYIFLAPYRNLDPGPYIYDNAGNLVWSGAGQSGPKTAHTPRVCRYRGEDHLCFFEGEQHQGFARGHGVIMNNHYQVVKTVDAAGAGASSDMHEFKITPYSNGTTALLTVYQPRQYDLTTNPRFNVVGGMGWIVEGVFQEVEIDTGRVVFEWRSLDHVDPGLAWTLPKTTDTSGDGLTEQSPWDYFHLNSIDKNEEGDYLISARHVSAIYKLSGKDGSIIWQMGGNAPTIKTTNFVFSYQHHARWLSENATHTVLSFWDNASNGMNTTGEFSHGWIISINHISEEAEMIKEWGAPEPEGGLLSGSQGNMQMLPNGGCHMSWGEHAYITEHTADGHPVMYAKLADRESNVMIYRSNKYNWTAQPLTKPALWTYSRNEAKMIAFASWNGATEIRSWNFYTSGSPDGPWELAGNVEKTGFETEFNTDRVATWTYAEALDGDGRALETSVITRTFVPSETLVEHCHDRGCDLSDNIKDTDEAVPYEAEVIVPSKYLSTERKFNTNRYYQDSPANQYLPDRLTSIRSKDGSLDTAIFLMAIGCLGGFAITITSYFLWTRGAFCYLQPVADAFANTRFGSKFMVKYQKLEDKEAAEALTPGSLKHRRNASQAGLA
ncbi:Arylsulfotransferase (ASST) [Teratosphaeria destructans]|uniref:Arylsulfotransferase (ASST) n=1 Tax=Teratosphaeria destructans TaxID=418781 RepID=A0A9W7SP06_9PEZI|nr:Arylsulfotransferase (ASST) [Teratosphaeria destructans]